MADTDEHLDQLYGFPLDEFTPARDRLAAELGEQGDRDAAARVKKLRRPSVSAWTVNQLVRNHRGEVQELLSVGDDVRAAQRVALSGGGAEKIREITGRRRRVVDRLLDRAEDLLARAGHATSRSTLDKVGDTLMAATVDEEAAGAVRAGRLVRELAPPSGLETLAGQIPVPAESASKRERQAQERAQRAEEQARDAEGAAEEADREARRLEEQAERTRQDAERARRRADRAAERAQELRRNVEDSGGSIRRR
jgi:hypothetical protein